jgi:hypothetical protein
VHLIGLQVLKHILHIPVLDRHCGEPFIFRQFLARLQFVFSRIRNLALYSQLFGKKIAISAFIVFKHLLDLDESLNILDDKLQIWIKIYILDENDTKFQMKKRFFATPATKTGVSSPIWLQLKYEKKSPDCGPPYSSFCSFILI